MESGLPLGQISTAVQSVEILGELGGLRGSQMTADTASRL